MDPWYKIATPRKEVRDGRSFNPDEFAIALEQVVAGNAPEDYRDPKQFFSRNCFTRALTEHAGMVLKRLAGKTENTAPVLTLVTQFGGGKTHTLTALYHLVKHAKKASSFDGVPELLRGAGLPAAPEARVAVFVGNAWDPQDGRETPWVDIAWQLAGDEGVEALGKAAKSKAPGTEALSRLYTVAGGSVLVLFDEVLNFINRHRDMADSFHAFIQNLTVSMTGITRGAAIISLPRSKVEMTDWDLEWQEKITKVVKRVAKDLIANDEAEISEVIRRRLFQDIGNERVRRNVAKAYADWCFERRAQLPPEWTAVDTAITEAKAREYLLKRFEACYPFHPATLSVFQRKWQTLPQYQQTRGTLAMLAQWISLSYREGYQHARREALISLGSAPLEVHDFREVILGQLGEPRLMAAIECDIAGQQSHAHVLDADAKGALRDIHKRVGAAILFESSGGQAEKVAHLPEMRFALGEPGMDTTSIDTAASTLEAKAFYILRAGSDGYKIRPQPTLKKVVSDRRASLDEETDIKPAMRRIIEQEYGRAAKGEGGQPRPGLLFFPEDSTAVPDSARLTLVVLAPEDEWTGDGDLRQRIAEWTKHRGKSDRLYPGALVWCAKKPGRDLRETVELWLAWKRVAADISDGTLGADLDRGERTDIQVQVREAEDGTVEEVWAEYRFVVVADNAEADGLKVVDLGAGHASGSETLSGRVIAALKSGALLNESIGAGYIDRNWPDAFKESGAWPLASLRQSFLNGSLTRLLDADSAIRGKVVQFVSNGDFGLASGRRADGGYERVWFGELISPDEVTFEPNVFLLRKAKAKSAKIGPEKPGPEILVEPEKTSTSKSPAEPDVGKGKKPAAPRKQTIRLVGELPPELFNRVGTKLVPKLRTGEDLRLSIDFTVMVNGEDADGLVDELRQILADLNLSGKVRVEKE